MNVSMQDGFNIAWKLGHVLDGRAPASLLDTYSAERQAVAQDLIDFDREWSGLMASRPGDAEDATMVEAFYVETFDFTTGFMTSYRPSSLTAEPTHQDLAAGFPIGMTFKSAPVVRVCDANPVHLGHQARADGRWRIYAFADGAVPGDAPGLSRWAGWLADDEDSPLRCTPADADLDAWFDVKAIYQGRFDAVDLGAVPPVFLPRTGPLGLVDRHKVFAAGPGPDGTGEDIFEVRGIARGGAVVVVRPDQYVATVLPLAATDELRAFFEPVVLGRVRSDLA
jgi:phenol 2-monooxygenase